MKSPGYPKTLRAFVALLAVMIVASVSSCGQNGSIVSPEITVVVDVMGLTPDITSLFVTPSLPGGQPQSGQEILSNINQFAIALPTSTTGTLTLSVVGRSAEHCVIASGTVSVDIAAPPTRYQVTVTLAPPANGSAKSCTLTVEVRGKGSVASTPPGIACTGSGTAGQPTICSYDFPVGSNLTLTATLDPKSYGAAFSGLCSGAGSCSFAYSGPGTVKVGFAGRVCSRDSWCWYNPLPQGNTLRGIWGSSDSDIWAVGDAGTILHFDGATWSAGAPIGGPTGSDLYAVYGTGPSDAWAVGTAGALIHWDGTSWTASQDSGVKANGNLLRAVWGSGPKDYWAVGNAGIILHFDGTGWSQAAGSGQAASTNPLYSLWGSGPSDVWASGPSGIIIHSTGAGWVADGNSGKATTASLFALSGSGPTDAIAMGSGGTTTRFSGAWALDNTVGPSGLSTVYGLWESGPGSAFAVGISAAGAGTVSRLSAGSWQAVSPKGATTLNAVWGTSASNVWAVGFYGSILHFDGSAWAPGPLVSLPTLPALEGIWGNAANDVWTVGLGGNIRHFDGTGWTAVPSGVTSDLYSVWGSNAGNVFAAGAAGTILHYDTTVGTNWTQVVSPTTNQLNGIFGYSATNVWFVGNLATVVNFTGTTASLIPISPLTTTANFYGAWGPSVFSLNVVGDSGTFISKSFFGNSWSNVAQPAGFASTLWRGIWGINTPAIRSFAVGYSGAISSYDGSTWTAVPTVGTAGLNNLSRVWGFNASSVFATTLGNAIYRFDGTTWTQQIPGKAYYFSGGLIGVYAASPTDAWAVGEFGTILRYMP